MDKFCENCGNSFPSIIAVFIHFPNCNAVSNKVANVDPHNLNEQNKPDEELEAELPIIDIMVLGARN